jgi:hypothetical protein
MRTMPLSLAGLQSSSGEQHERLPLTSPTPLSLLSPSLSLSFCSMAICTYAESTDDATKGIELGADGLGVYG